MSTIVSYWRSTGKRFKATHNPVAAAKRKTDQITNRRRGRKRQVRDLQNQSDEWRQHQLT